MQIAGKSWILKACLCAMGVSLVSSCTVGKHPFLMVQVCLENDGGVSQFKNELQEVAREGDMRYMDGSRDTERNLMSTGVLEHPPGKFVHLAVVADGGPSLNATNLSLNTFDVAVGFADYGNQSDRVFADRVVARLRQHWEVKVVPDGSGAFPDPECTQGTATPPNNSFNPMPLRGTG